MSILACGSAFQDAADGLIAGGAGAAGVHLCLVGGEGPVSEPARIPSLLSNGRFRAAWPAVAAAAGAGRIRPAEVEREWDAQIDRIRAAGLLVTHLDSHQHLHLLPSLLPIAIRLAHRHAVRFIRAPRGDDPAAGGGSLPPGPRLRARLLAALGANARRALVRADLAEPPRVLGLAEAGRMTAERWSRLLDGLPDSGDFEAVLHPGTDDEATKARYDWGYAWAEESTALESPAFREALSARGIETVSFASL